MPSLDADTIDRVRGCIWGLCIADALAMPVHWFYNPDDIVSQFGQITKYEAPKEKQHNHSFMNAAGTYPHDKDGKQVFVIGDVINHGKREFWGVEKMHYHQGFQPGENTLNTLCTRLAMRTITANGGTYDAKKWLEEYIAFMTTPGSHNDTYAETYHRDFFLNFSKGEAPENCSKPVGGHNLAHVGSLNTMAPVILAALASSGDAAAAVSTAMTHLHTLVRSPELDPDAKKYSEMICDLVRGESASTVLKKAGLLDRLDPASDDKKTVYKTFGPACNIDQSMPVSAHFLLKYEKDFQAGVLGNANVGGENCHRGAAIGALLGAANGEKGIPQSLRDGLHASKSLKAEIDAFVAVLQT